MKLTQAQISAIRALEDEHGRITPQQVVDAARDIDSPLHALIDWDTDEASAKWWLHQAREIIGAVTIQVTTQHSMVKTPHYVVDTEVQGSGYRSVSEMRKDPESARESLVLTLSVAAGHIRRAFELAGPLGMQDEINSLLMQITGLQTTVSKKAA